MTIYVDGGMFEYTYRRKSDNSIDPDLDCNSLNVKDGASLLATIQVGVNTDDQTPKIKYNITNHLDNSNVMLDSSGALINREEYYPFGETSFGSFRYKRYRYNGKEKDEHTGLYEYGARYYAPWMCRFVSVDPIAEDYPQYTSYNYAGNKPISKRDLEGLQEQGADPEGLNKGKQQSGVEALSSMGTPSGTIKSKDNGNFWGELGRYAESTIVKGIKGAIYLLDSPNHEGHNIGAKRPPTREELEAYNNTVKDIVNPVSIVENLVESAIEGPPNIYEGIAEKDGAKFGEGVFQVGEVFGALYGAKKIIPKAKKGFDTESSKSTTQKGFETIPELELGNIDDFVESQISQINTKIGHKLAEGRLPYPMGREGFEQAKESIVTTLNNPTETTNVIPSSSVRGDYDLIHIFSEKSGNTVSLRVLENKRYEFDTLIPGKSSKF